MTSPSALARPRGNFRILAPSISDYPRPRRGHYFVATGVRLFYLLAYLEHGFLSAHDLSETISAAGIVTALAINSEFSLGLP
jgi:hypothetical protein